MTVRYYSSIAQQTTLTASITPSTTTIAVAATTGFPGSTPFVLALDYGTIGEELVDVTLVAGLNLTVTRAVDGTSAASHNAGAVVKHVMSGRDLSDSRTHENSSQNVHGVSGVGNDVVGTTSTQTLSNKTLNRATGTLQRVDIFNTGNWVTSVVGDSANPTFSRLHILDNELNLNEMAVFRSNGALFLYKASGEADNTYRIRLTDNDQTTDRFAVTGGGNVQITPTSMNTASTVFVSQPDADPTKRSIRTVSGGTNDRFVVWNDGRVDIVGSAAAQSQLDVLAAPSQSANVMQVQDSAANNYFDVGNAGLSTARRRMDVRTTDAASAVLRVFAANPGPQTGDIEQWIDSSNVVQAAVSANGSFVLNKDLSVTGIGSMRGARKTADQTITNSTTQTNDTHLFLSVEANAVYTIDGYIVYNALAAADVNLAFTVPASATGSWTGVGVGLAQSASNTDGYTVRTEQNTITQVRGFGGIESTGVAQDMTVMIKGLVTTAGTAGTLRLQWAQRAANAQGTILRTDSWLRIHRIA